jgi:hypothetical protein
MKNMKYSKNTRNTAIIMTLGLAAIIGAICIKPVSDSPEYQKREINRQETAYRKSFEKFDLDKNGSIDYSEYKSMIYHLPLAGYKTRMLELMVNEK